MGLYRGCNILGRDLIKIVGKERRVEMGACPKPKFVVKFCPEKRVSPSLVLFQSLSIALPGAGLSFKQLEW